MPVKKKAAKKAVKRKKPVKNIFAEAAKSKTYKAAKKKAAEYLKKAASAYKAAIKKAKSSRKKK